MPIYTNVFTNIRTRGYNKVEKSREYIIPYLRILVFFDINLLEIAKHQWSFPIPSLHLLEIQVLWATDQFVLFITNLMHTFQLKFNWISSVQLLSLVRLFETPWIAALQVSMSITNSQSLPKPMSIESVMPSSHLILCPPLLLLPPIPPRIRIFSNESTLHMRWPKY